MVSGRPLTNRFRWGEQRHALGLAWVQSVLPQFACDRKRPTCHRFGSVRDSMNDSSLGHPAKMDYRFIPLVNKKRMLSALSIVTPPFLSICSFLLKVSCRWVVLWSCYPSIKTRTFYILMPFSYSPLVPFGLASSLTPSLVYPLQGHSTTRPSLFRSDWELPPSSSLSFYLCIYIRRVPFQGFDGYGHNPHLPSSNQLAFFDLVIVLWYHTFLRYSLSRI